MARQQFYLVRRKDKLNKNAAGRLQPTYYCRLRDEEGDLLPWKSTGETAKTRAELWALNRVKSGANTSRENLTFGTYAAPWCKAGCAYCEGRLARGASITIGCRKVHR